ncbi:probable Flavohemoprotein [Zygosaccharomyces bailii]|nr:probable Flavohemoprotein [Zygosaccharomyces bailii]
MLSPETRSIIKATVPVLEQHGTTITSVFYKNMLNEHEELRNVFNRINQVQGAQPAALATTVLAAAKHIDDLSVLAPYVNMIGHKHRALQIKPEQYLIVGHYLLAAIKQVLGDAAKPEILEAWRQAYGEIADVFINVEADLYKEASWPGWKPFRVVSRENVASDIVEFTVAPEPESGIDLSRVPIVAGQYITVNVHPTTQGNKYDALRHYSICSISKDKGLRFAVKLEKSEEHADGLVSEFLDDHTSVGDRILLSAPAGDFALDKSLIHQNKIPLVLLCSGVGATPVMSMLEKQVAENPQRPVYWMQSSYDESRQAFKDQVDEFLDKCDNSHKFIVHTSSEPRIALEWLEREVPANADIYICGSVSFMRSMIEYLGRLNQSRIQYELFGPKMATIKV